MRLVLILLSIFLTSILVSHAQTETDNDDLLCILDCFYDMEAGITTSSEVFETLIANDFIQQTTELTIRNLMEHSVIEIQWNSNNTYSNSITIVEDIVFSIRLVPDKSIILDDFIAEYSYPAGFRPHYRFRDSVSDGEQIPIAVFLYYPSMGLRARFAIEPEQNDYTVTPDLELAYVDLFVSDDELTSFIPNTLLLPTNSDQIQALISSVITEDFVYGIRFLSYSAFLVTGDIYELPAITIDE